MAVVEAHVNGDMAESVDAWGIVMGFWRPSRDEVVVVVPNDVVIVDGADGAVVGGDVVGVKEGDGNVIDSCCRLWVGWCGIWYWNMCTCMRTTLFARP